MGLMLLLKAPERSLAPSAVRGYSSKSVPWKRPLTQSRWHSELGLPASRTVSNIFLLFISHLVYGICLNGLRQLDDRQHSPVLPESGGGLMVLAYFWTTVCGEEPKQSMSVSLI